ncbi:MAG: bifunctional glutamate N-acetyltransferase/amino-acid acetyltransferase ArgJ [Verrucomicrobiae bacterium]|nr:bifunctional glutamate N-acetyltransferase/amino-acid acetyltransferase ArgJ [Verrucomicrobiae bacterium]
MFRRVEEGVCAAAGFRAAGVAAGIKKTGKLDLSLVVSDRPCAWAGTFTTNAVKAAPVLFDLALPRARSVRGIVANSGNANACTGAQGLRDAVRMDALAREAAGSASIPFLIASTGRIGGLLPMAKVAAGLRTAAARLSRDDLAAARAIMTTDTFPKRAAAEIRVGGRVVRIGGMAKGAGMICPGMSRTGRRPALHATMLAFLATDAAIAPAPLQRCLERAVARSFNRISVDGDMSTNDTVLLLANGAAGAPALRDGSRALADFQAALDDVTLRLAQGIVRDGEGISKVVTVVVEGAASAADAERAVRAIGNSILVKCSWCGEDPNWGRLFDAAGYSGARLNLENLSVHYDGVPLVLRSRRLTANARRACAVLKKPAFTVRCGLGVGRFSAVFYTTDLTEKYVELNKGE